MAGNGINGEGNVERYPTRGHAVAKAKCKQVDFTERAESTERGKGRDEHRNLGKKKKALRWVGIIQTLGEEIDKDQKRRNINIIKYQKKKKVGDE